MKRNTLTKQHKKIIQGVYNNLSLNNTAKADEVNKQLKQLKLPTFDESAYRKYFATYKEGYSKGITQTNLNDEWDALSKNEARFDYHKKKEQKKLTFQRQIIHKETYGAAKKELWLETIKQTIKDIEPIKVSIPKISLTQSPKQKHMIIFTIADLQFTGTEAEKVYIREVLWRKLMKLITHTYANYKHIGIAFLGDDVEGMLHKGQTLEVEKGTIQQTLNLIPYYQLIVRGCANLLKINNRNRKLHIYFVSQSNHGQIRHFSSQRSEFPNEDVGYVLLEAIIQRIKADNLDNVILKSSGKDGVIKDTLTKTWFAHGHHKWMGKQNDILARIPKDYNFVTGHWHHTESFQTNNRMLIKAPSVRYAKTNNFEIDLGVNASKAIGIISYDENGICEGIMNYYLDKGER